MAIRDEIKALASRYAADLKAKIGELYTLVTFLLDYSPSSPYCASLQTTLRATRMSGCSLNTTADNGMDLLPMLGE